VGSRYFRVVDAMLPDAMPTVKQCISIDRKDEKRLYYEDVINSASSDDRLLKLEMRYYDAYVYGRNEGRPKGVPLRHMLRILCIGERGTCESRH